MISIKNVNKYFYKNKKNEIHVINNTSLELPNTGLIALLGPSGSGKTTLLNVIGGLDKVNNGEIYINNKKITRFNTSKIDEIRNLSIGYIFQDYHLIDDMKVFDNVALVLKMIGIKDSEEIKKRVNYVLEILGIYKYKNRLASMLSGGERQRVGIARAIVKNPDIIIADEPTGNLDSKNTIEIMNIIKSISKDKLVILVTHEKDIAYFYSSRVIELLDGKIISDNNNEHNNELDYRIDNKIYLKDIENHKRIEMDNLKVDFYSENKNNLNIKLVVKNGNIYIESDTKEKIEVIDDNSSLELVDDNYKKISKESYEKYKFDFNKIINDNFKLKYTSIFNPISLLISGFKKLNKYSILKKILLLGFFVSSMFVLYSVSNIMGILTIKDEKFIKHNKNYISVVTNKIDSSNYLKYESLDNINYIMPRDSDVTFNIKYNYYYQTMNASDNLTGSLSSIDMISDKDIIYGTMPSNEYEIVVDKLSITNMFKSYMAKQVGIINYEDIVGLTAKIKNMNDFKIVGIVDLKSPSIYANNKLFINILSNTSETNDYDKGFYVVNTFDIATAGGINTLVDYSLYQDKITLKQGKYPENDYEVMVNYNNKDTYKLNKEIDIKVNDKKLKVVGYYSSYEYTDMLVNNNMIKQNLLSSSKNITIYPKDKASALKYFKEEGVNVIDSYNKDRSDYLDRQKDSMISAIVIAGIVLIISLVEIFLMIRSSFLSRVKEVGIYRVVGVKKKDIYKMFLGEILAITIIASIPGLICMFYILNGLITLPMFIDYFLLNPFILLISAIIVVGFNILIGLMPVYTTLLKTPAQILSRIDVD